MLLSIPLEMTKLQFQVSRRWDRESEEEVHRGMARRGSYASISPVPVWSTLASLGKVVLDCFRLALRVIDGSKI